VGNHAVGGRVHAGHNLALTRLPSPVEDAAVGHRRLQPQPLQQRLARLPLLLKQPQRQPPHTTRSHHRQHLLVFRQTQATAPQRDHDARG
jgi:hypothetical protein